MHSADARARVVGAARLWCTPLHRAEWTHALAQHVFRGQLNSADFRKIEQDFEGDLKAGVWERVELPEIPGIFALISPKDMVQNSAHGLSTACMSPAPSN